MATGRPCSGPSASPRITDASASRAAARARPVSSVTTAFTAGFTRAMRARQESSSSSGDRARAPTRRRSSVAGRSQGSVMAGAPWLLGWAHRRGHPGLVLQLSFRSRRLQMRRQPLRWRRIMPAQSASVLAWRDELGALEARLGGLFGRPEPRRQAGLYLEGLLSATKRKNGWQLAEQIGDARPWRTQRLLSHVLWDQDAARDLCRDYVAEHLGAPDGVLIVDETGFLKKGEHPAGVARQYSGTAGRIENAQIGVFLAYASGKGHALIDRELYLPRKEWCEEEAKRAEAAIPEEVAFATKPALASRMIGRALDAGLPCAWVLGDESYGSDRRLRRELERRGQAFVLAIRGNEKLWSKLHGRPGRPGRHAIADIAAALPARACRPAPAGASRPGPAARGSGSTTGLACRPPIHDSRPGGAGCWSGAAARTRRTSPSTSPPARSRPRSPPSRGSPAGAGPSRSASRSPSNRSAWPITRSAPGTAGTGTSPSPRSLWPSSPPCA